MLAKRIIPCLDVKNGRVVKGQQFKNLKDVDAPERLGKKYSLEGADELVFYDITASHEQREISLGFVKKVAQEINIPFSVGGGLKTMADIQNVLKMGADKVSLNSAVIDDPSLITKASTKYGAQCIVVSMDVKEVDGDYVVYKNGGRVKTHLNALDWAVKAVQLGAGELVINSMNHDGMKAGFDIKLLNKITDLVNVPVIASGGAGSIQDFIELGQLTSVDGYLAASVFHYNEITLSDLKNKLKENDILVRIER
jgi:cyclase